MPVSFQDVGLAVLSERAYQDSKWKELDAEVNTLDDMIGYIQKYAEFLKGCVNDADKLANIRKVTALGVATMEKFGAPHREGFEKSHQDLPLIEFEIGVKEDVPELTPEQIDNVIAQEQEAVKIERGVYYRVNEISRMYIYDDPSATHRFDDIRAFCVMPSGGHRLLNKYGTWYYVQPGWRVLMVPKAEVV
jgi:hypothetical protein